MKLLKDNKPSIFFNLSSWQTLQERNLPQAVEDGNSPHMQRSLESYIHQQPLAPPERYPIPETDFNDANSSAFVYDSGNLSVEQKNEYLVTTRNSIELLSSILNAESEPKAIKVISFCSLSF